MNNTYYRRYRPNRTHKPSSFKSFFWFVVTLVVLALGLRACVSVFTTAQAEKRDEAVLSIDKGSAEVTVWGEQTASSALNAQILFEGDEVATNENSYVTLKLHNGSELHMDESTTLTFLSTNLLDESEEIVFQLLSGRVWMDILPNEMGEFTIITQTDVVNAVVQQGEFLVSNVSGEESVYGFDGQADLEFVDRGEKDVLIERATLRAGTKSIWGNDKVDALIARQHVTLTEKTEQGDLSNDPFVMWSLGTVGLGELDEEEGVVDLEEVEEEEEAEVFETEVVEDEPEPEPEPEAEVEVDAADTIQISILSPSSGSTIGKDAIAIEGRVSSGVAERITVEWSGNGEEYPLGLFEAGGESFRYVADVNYANFALGENTYIIRAYDADGKLSDVISLVLVGQF
jgi:hypothetical protein